MISTARPSAEGQIVRVGRPETFMEIVTLRGAGRTRNGEAVPPRRGA
jgi:hypothetical protein